MFIRGELRVKASKCFACSLGLQPWCWRNVPKPRDAGALCNIIAMKIIMPRALVSPKESTVAPYKYSI